MSGSHYHSKKWDVPICFTRWLHLLLYDIQVYLLSCYQHQVFCLCGKTYLTLILYDVCNQIINWWIQGTVEISRTWGLLCRQKLTQRTILCSLSSNPKEINCNGIWTRCGVANSVGVLFIHQIPKSMQLRWMMQPKISFFILPSFVHGSKSSWTGIQ